MSRYCAIRTFVNGRAADKYRFDNSWGGAAFIWECLYDRFLKDPEKPHDCWLNSFREDEGKSLRNSEQRQSKMRMKNEARVKKKKRI